MIESDFEEILGNAKKLPKLIHPADVENDIAGFIKDILLFPKPKLFFVKTTIPYEEVRLFERRIAEHDRKCWFIGSETVSRLIKHVLKCK